MATLTSVVSDEFGSLNEVGCYGTSVVSQSPPRIPFTLTSNPEISNTVNPQLAGMLLNRSHSRQNILLLLDEAYMASFFVFIISSVVAASAPNLTAFVVRRGLSGLGSAGVFAASGI